MPAVSADGMLATSHPQATLAGLRVLMGGGNAVDAALAAAGVLTVAEPGDNGPGGDAFAIVWHEGALHGLNGSGRSPAAIDDGGVAERGPRSVTVPGAVRAWADLAAAFGTRGLDAVLGYAIDIAERGLACTPRVADRWRQADASPLAAPAVGERYTLPGLAGTLRRIAGEGPAALYEGDLANRIAASCWLDETDLAAHRSEWVDPIRYDYRGVEVCELPPNGQGAAALLALALYDGLEPGLHSQIEAVKLALADAHAYIADAPLPPDLFEPSHLARRRAQVRPDTALDPSPSRLPRGGTTYLCAVDASGTAISLIQSLYHPFGSGVLVPDTGIVLQNRGAGFVDDPGHPNALEPSKRPYHTIIPGMLLEGGELLGPFGVMGGPMQPQGHFQVVVRLVDHGDDPQSALDAPRFRVDGGRSVELEPGLWPAADQLQAAGHDVHLASSPHGFGVGQIILRHGSALVGGSDGRGDGYAAGV